MSKSFKLLVTQTGQLYFLALEDMVMGMAEPIYVLKGKYRTGQPATTLTTSSTNWFSGELSQDSHVSIHVVGHEGEKAPTLPKNPSTLQEHLKALAEQGFTRIRIQGHDVQRDNASNNYTVKHTSPIVLEVPVVEGQAAKVTPANVGNTVDVVAVKKSPYICITPKLRFLMKTNRLDFGYPEVTFKKPYRFTKGAFINLAW